MLQQQQASTTGWPLLPASSQNDIKQASDPYRDFEHLPDEVRRGLNTQGLWRQERWRGIQLVRMCCAVLRSTCCVVLGRTCCIVLRGK